MLPADHRLTSPDDFRRTIRSGSKQVTPTVIVHCSRLDRVDRVDGMESTAPARFGITVSKAVGGSVVRHRVSRRIRHAIADAMKDPSIEIPPGSRWVLRALPRAAEADVASDVRTAIARTVLKSG